MKFRFVLVALALVLLVSSFLFLILKQRAPSPAQSLRVPEGFVVERVAGPPLVDRPIVADFDELGRLYVADSSGSNDPVQKQLTEKPHRIVRLEDSDGDGRYDKSVVFADKMMFPEGAMWFDGSLYVAAPPSIWKLTDTNNDGIAEQREEWFDGKTLTNCANDLHGPYLGLDGWIYWCKGAFGQQTYERGGKPPFVTRAAHIFRRRPGSSLVEPVMTGGMDNPVDVAFTPEGERILTATFFQQPGVGRRDGLIHAIYGGVYGKVHDVIEGHKRTGELMPVLTHFGPAAPCGLTHYASRAFGTEYENNFFACLFNMHKVTRHELAPSGATFTTRDSDFLLSPDSDFHPTDVIEDADGSLLVIDTGAWYKLCCPTSQLAKPDVLGAIYRVRRKDAARVKDSRGLTLSWPGLKLKELAELLDDSRPAVRQRAMHELAKHGVTAVPTLAETLQRSSSVRIRRNAVWTLCRIEGDAARAAVRLALKDPSASVRQAASHSVSVWRDDEALPQLLEILKSSPAPVQRAAAEALGRIGNHRAVPELLASVGRPSDRSLHHSATYALIEIADSSATAEGLKSASVGTQRAALIALDQMEGGRLSPGIVTPLLVSGDADLKQTASWIVGRHPEWGRALAGFFRNRLTADLSTEERRDLERQLAALARGSEIQALLAEASRGAGPREQRETALRAMALASLKEMPESWATGVAAALNTEDGDLVRQAVSTARALPSPGQHSRTGLRAALLAVLDNTRFPTETRLAAAAAIPDGLNRVEPQMFDFLASNIDSSLPVTHRSHAASVLAKAKLAPGQLLTLAGLLKNAGPLELSTLLACFKDASDEELGLKLVAVLQQSRGLMSLRQDVLEPAIAKFPDSVRKKGAEILASLDVDTAAQKARLDGLLARLQVGDIRRGQAVFNSTKAACSSCHTIGYLGGNIGPDLTRIGEIRNERDLLESIVYPSASFVRSYEPLVVVTKSGDVYNGVVRKDGSEEILLATGPKTEARLQRSEIKEMRPGTVSVMPGGVENELSGQELADLLAFLKRTRWGAR